MVKEASKLSSGPLLTSMAACHSLTIIEEKLVGDPLDLIMFEATEWVSAQFTCHIVGEPIVHSHIQIMRLNCE